MYHHGSVKNKHIFKQGLYCFSICCCAADEFSVQLSPAKSVCAGLGAGAGSQSNPGEGNGGEGSECDTNRKRALCSCLLLGAHERFIPNFVFFQGILWALPGAYITNTSGRYQLTKALKSVTDLIFSFTQTYVSADLSY